MAYCSSEGKFAGFDEPTVEVENEDVTDDELQVSVRVVRPCAGCGNEQAETNLEFNLTIDHQCPDEDQDEPDPKFTQTLEERTFEVQGDVEVEPVDEYQTTDRHGKPIRNTRYQRHLIGASVSATVTCSRCEEEIQLTDQQTEPASSFEDQGSH